MTVVATPIIVAGAEVAPEVVGPLIGNLVRLIEEMVAGGLSLDEAAALLAEATREKSDDLDRDDQRWSEEFVEFDLQINAAALAAYRQRIAGAAP